MSAYIFKIITLLGGLALFLFGMDIMGKALERQAGGKLQTILAKMSSNVFKGFLLGRTSYLDPQHHHLHQHPLQYQVIVDLI